MEAHPQQHPTNPGKRKKKKKKKKRSIKKPRSAEEKREEAIDATGQHGSRQKSQCGAQHRPNEGGGQRSRARKRRKKVTMHESGAIDGKEARGRQGGSQGKKEPLAFASANAELLSLEPNANPYLDEYKRITAEFPADINRLFDPKLPGGDLRRALLFDLLPDEMPEKYAWAVPDARALRIIKHFGPVVEIACGAGYWGKLLLDRGVEWQGYDMRGLERAWTPIRKGGPEVLKSHEMKGKTLMLCYPDDFEESMESVATACLKNYKGSTVIHIGELYPNTHMENPWGKTTASDFQLELAHAFHKILQVPLPSWPSSIDCLTVWKRSRRTQMDDMELRFIPDGERIDLVQASPDVTSLVL